MGMRMMMVRIARVRMATMVVIVRAVADLLVLDAGRVAGAIRRRTLPSLIGTTCDREHDEERERALHGFFFGGAPAIFFLSAASSSSTVTGGRRVD